jgi:hypothetical protein
MTIKEKPGSPDDQENRLRMLSFFGSHLVALCIIHLGLENEGPQFKAYSGTLLRVDDRVLWVTAGHILEAVYEALNSGKRTVGECVLADAFGEAFISEAPIPIDLTATPHHYVHDDSAGLDYGALLLHPHHVRLLEANGVRVVEEENWNRQHNVDFEGFMMIGLPEEFTSSDLSPEGHGTVSPTIFGVRSVENPSDRQTEHPRFIGKINPGNEALQSAVGMSGGPIFGVAHIDALRYWVVAIQSSWLKRDRIVFGCPMPVIGPMLTEWVRSQTEVLETKD